MIINIKYYVITILAIFLAIAVGIFIGIMLDGQDLIAQQQQQIVVQLQKEFDQIKVIQDKQQIRINELINENEKNLKFIDRVYPGLIRDKLTGLNIVILETTEDYSYFSLIDSFEKAGANSVASIIIKDSFMLNSEDEASMIAQSLGLTEGSVEDIQQELNLYLSDSLINGDQEKINALKELQLVDFLNNIEFPMDNLIIAGGSSTEDKSRLNIIDLPIAEYFRTNEIPIVVVEKTSVDHSIIQDFKKIRVTTVDNADTLIGKVSIVMAILGKEGNFGEKSTAEDLLPTDFLTPDQE